MQPLLGSGTQGRGKIKQMSFQCRAGEVNVNVFLNNTQPILKSGQLHWAFNDITTYKTPACSALLSDLYTARQGYLDALEVYPGNVSQDISSMQTANSSISPQACSNSWRVQKCTWPHEFSLRVWGLGEKRCAIFGHWQDC